MTIIANLPFVIDDYIKSRSKPDIENFLTMFRKSINIAEASGSGTVISALKVSGSAYRYIRTETETEVKTCPATSSGELRFRHIFPSGKTPITDVDFEAQKTGFTNILSQILKGTTDKDGYGVLQGCEAGAEYKITFYPDYRGTSKKAIDEAFQKIINDMESLLRNQWDTKLSGGWDDFIIKYQNQTEFEKAFDTIKTYSGAFKDAIISVWDTLVSIIKAIVNNWDSITETVVKYSGPVGYLAATAYRGFFASKENAIDKFIEDVIKKLKELDPLEVEKIFFLLVDKSLMYVLFATLVAWIFLLPPDLLSEFVARGFAEIILNILLAVIFSPSVISNVGRTITVHAKQLIATTKEVIAGLKVGERLAIYLSELAESMAVVMKAAMNMYLPKPAIIANSSIADESRAVSIIANKVEDVAEGSGKVAQAATTGEKTVPEIVSSNPKDKFLTEATPEVKPAATATEKPTNPTGETVKSDAQTIKDGEPISMVTGEELLTLTDTEIKGVLPFIWKRQYRTSAAEINRGLGYGWSHSLNQELKIKDNKVYWTNEENITTILPLPTQQLPMGVNHQAEAAIYLGKDPSEFILVQTSGQGFYHFKRTNSGLQLEAISDKYNNRIIITRNNVGQIHRVHNCAGRGLLFHYHNSHIIAVDYQQQLAGDTEERSWKTIQRIVSYEYNQQNQLIKTSNALGESENYQYDQQNVIQSRQMAGGAIFYWQWQGEGKQARCIKHWSNFEQLQTNYDWDDKDTVTVTRKDGSQLVYTHQDAKLVKQINPDGGEILKAYDELGNLIAERSPLGAETLYEYDGKRLTSIIPAEGDAINYIYSNGQISHIIQGETEWRYQYNEQGDITQQIDPLGNTTQYEYTSTGKVKNIRYPDGSIHQLTWNKLGQLIEEILPQGGIRRYRYDSLGNQITRQDETGKITQLNYDSLGRLNQITNPDGTQRHYRYNAYHKVTQITDEQGNTTQYEYANHLHLISKKINPDGSVVQYQYNNPDLHLTDIINEQGEHYHLDYYSNGLISQEIGFDGRKISYQYDLASNLIAKTDYDQQNKAYKTKYLRSPTGKLLQKTLPDGNKIDYNYNQQGLLTHINDGNWPLHYEYDTTGKLTAEHQGWATIRYQYSPLGILSQCKLPDGNIIDYKYNRGGQLAHIQLNNQKLTSHYYSLGKEVERQQGQLTSQYDYDEQGRLQAHFINQQNHNLYQRHYQYTANGNLAEINDSRKGIRQYYYDPLDRLTKVRGDISEDLIHDPAGNLLTQDQQTKQANIKGNRLLMQGDKHFTYDAFGNLIQERRGQAQKLITNYEYDCQHRLQQATLPDGTIATYQYDAFGRRINKTVIDKTGNKTKTEFIWLGEKLLAESSKNHYQTYLYELGTFKPLALLKGKGKKAEIYYYQLDHLGTPQELTNIQGCIVWSAKYKAYGNLALEQAHDIEQPLRFQGQYHDLETGLYYNFYRYYNPTIGRYITPDPIKLMGGINNYRYTTNPVGWSDPLGLFEVSTTSKVTPPEGVPMTQQKFDEVLNTPKGQRPDPETYLPPEYINAHQDEFGNGASRVVNRSAYEKRGIGKPDEGKTEFVSPSKDIDSILEQSNGDINQVAGHLGLPAESLKGDSLVRIDFISNKSQVKIPSGNEFGANDQWLPGGKLPTGKTEGIIKTEGMVKDIDYKVTDLKTGQEL